MTITVGTDTYITLEDASTYLALHYIAADVQLVAWEALDDADQEIYLRNAMQAIENLPYPGRKQDVNQALNFPRYERILEPVRRRYDRYSYPYSIIWLESGSVPDNVKFAQVEEALELASPSNASAIKSRLGSGLNSFRIGNFSESIKGGSTGANTVSTRLASIKAQNLLLPYQQGSFKTK